jgi:hypothetical protein
MAIFVTKTANQNTWEGKEKSLGKLVQMDNEIVYRQDDGEITAWLTGFEEKTALAHQGSRFYKRVFHLCVIVGVIYLAVLFWVL